MHTEDQRRRAREAQARYRARLRAEHPRENPTCTACGATFTPRRGQSSGSRLRVPTCSKRCAQLRRNNRARETREQHRRPRPCEICGTEITSVRRTKQTCGTQCGKQRRTLIKYGLTKTQWEAMYSAQQRGCAICGHSVVGGPGNILHVDHDHTTGKVRGLLCSSCNLGIGALNDDPALLRQAINYLESHTWHVMHNHERPSKTPAGYAAGATSPSC